MEEKEKEETDEELRKEEAHLPGWKFLKSLPMCSSATSGRWNLPPTSRWMSGPTWGQVSRCSGEQVSRRWSDEVSR